MTSSRLRKYNLGRSQKSRHQEKTGKLLLECGVNDYLANQEREHDEGGVAVMTVPANRVDPTEANGNMAQMHLWNQPVNVSTAPVAQAATAVPSGETPSESREPRMNTVVTSEAAPTALGSERNVEDRVTVVGVLKGCGMGLAAAAALVLIYVLIH